MCPSESPTRTNAISLPSGDQSASTAAPTTLRASPPKMGTR
ncbi:MAG: hypothetical protein ABIT01_03640 [Thermoanaerobaculia bacterium]